MKKLLKYIAHFKKNLVLSGICHLFTAIFTVVSIPLIIPFFQILFEREVPVLNAPDSVFQIGAWLKYFGAELLNNYGKMEALIMVCGFIVLVFFLKNIFRYLAAFFIIPVRNGVIKNIRSDLYHTYLKLPSAFFDHHKRGDLISRLNADASEIEWSILSFLEVLFKSPLIIIGSLSFMLYVSPQLSVFVFILLLFTVGVIGFVSRKLKQESGIVQEKIGRMTSLVEQSLTGIEIVKSYQAEPYLETKFENYNRSIFSGLNKILRRKDLSSPLSEFLGVTIVAILLAYGSTLVFQKLISPETFFAFIFAFYQVIEPAKSFSTAYYNLKKGMAAVDRIDEILVIPGKSNQSARVEVLPENWDAIRVENLDFSFPNVNENINESSNRVLNDISFEIPQGTTMAVIGSSGSGKSTILKLLLQQYDKYTGSIKVGQTDLKSVTLESLRSGIAIVTQSPILFNDSIKQNILLGRPYDASRFNQIIQQTLLTDLIKKLPQGIEHLVGDSGNLLSGGEKQRISIARALYGEPQILLLDEATSSLDAKSEKEVTKAIHEAIKNRTAIIIAHRLSTIELVENVLVLEDGVVEQFGDLGSLANKKGNFKSYLETYKTV